MNFNGKQNKKREAYSEKKDILKSINEVRNSMNVIYENLNYCSDELMTDSLNYELLALKSRHKSLINRAKEINLTSTN